MLSLVGIITHTLIIKPKVGLGFQAEGVELSLRGVALSLKRRSAVFKLC